MLRRRHAQSQGAQGGGGGRGRYRADGPSRHGAQVGGQVATVLELRPSQPVQDEEDNLPRLPGRGGQPRRP